MTHRVPASVWAGILGLGLSGCGSGHPPTVPVEGVVRFDSGEVVKSGTVECTRTDGTVTARGKIDKSGRFRLGTFAPADGAQPGSYKVIVLQLTSAEDLPGVQHDHGGTVNSRHAEYGTSGLTLEVGTQGRTDVELVVTHGVVERASTRHEMPTRDGR
jgi:hypothetical protein